MAEIYTKSVIQIGDETFRNLPAQVDRDQEVSYDANLKSQQAISTATDAQTKAIEAKAAADSAQTTANAAQAKAIEAKTAADTAQSTADAAQTAANTAQSAANTAQTAANEAYDLADSATELATQAQGELADALGSKVVRYDETQLLSEDQMLTARGNIEAAPITGTVRYDITQNLTDVQKTKARTNIGAGTPVTVDQNLIENSTNPVAGGAVYRETTTNRNAITNLQGLLMDFAQDSAVRYDMAQTLTDEQKAQARANIGAGTGGGGGSTEGAVLYNQAQTLTDQQKSQARTNIDAGKQVTIDSKVTLASPNPPSCTAVSAAMPYIITDPYNYFNNRSVAGIHAVQAQTNAEKSMTKFGYYIDSNMIYQMSSTVVQNVDDYTVLNYTFDASANKNYDLHYFLIFNSAGIYGSNTYVDLALSAPDSTSSYNTMIRLPIKANAKLAAIGVHFDRSNKLIKPVIGICDDNYLSYSLVPSFANGFLTKIPHDTPNLTPYGYQPIENYRKVSFATSSTTGEYTYTKENLGYHFKLTFLSVNDDTNIIYKAGIYNYAG